MKPTGYSSRRWPCWVALLLDKNKKLMLQFSKDKKKLKKVWKNFAWSDEFQFLLQYTDVSLRLCERIWKYRFVLPCINGSNCWSWWCNGMSNIFLSCIGTFGTNKRFKCCNVPRIVVDLMPQFMTIVHLSFGGLFQQDNSVADWFM